MLRWQVSLKKIPPCLLQNNGNQYIVHYISNALWQGEVNALLILNSNSSKPIYVQIAEWIETEILSDALQADQKVYSQYQLADMLNINPATAGKGLSLLVDEEVLYKKRGLGMFVSEKAKNIILMRRKSEMLGELIGNLVKEAAYLNVSEEELIRLIREEMGRGNEG